MAAVTSPLTVTAPVLVSVFLEDAAARAMAQLHRLNGCEAHSTVILSPVDENIFRRLKINLTCDPNYQTRSFYHP